MHDIAILAQACSLSMLIVLKTHPPVPMLIATKSCLMVMTVTVGHGRLSYGGVSSHLVNPGCCWGKESTLLLAGLSSRDRSSGGLTSRGGLDKWLSELKPCLASALVSHLWE